MPPGCHGILPGTMFRLVIEVTHHRQAPRVAAIQHSATLPGCHSLYFYLRPDTKSRKGVYLESLERLDRFPDAQNAVSK